MRKASVLGRYTELDGIRGWASLVVVIHHLTGDLFGSVFPQFLSPWFLTFADGFLAVSIFFVLSGAALSLSFMQTGDPASIDRLVVKRYPRLTIPIFFACVLTYFVLKLGLNFNVATNAVVNGPGDWLNSLDFNPSILSMVNFSLFRVYTPILTLDENYNPFLWTMHIEMAGSLLLFAMLYLLPVIHPRYAYPALAAPAAIFFLWHPTLSCFFAGAMLARMKSEARATETRDTGVELAICLTVAATVLLVRLSHGAPNFQYYSQVHVVLAVALVYLITNSSIFSRLLNSRVSLFMGHISFPLFLVQFPVIVSFTSFLVLWAAHNHALTISAAWLIIAVSIAACLAVAWAFSIVETLTAAVCRRVSVNFSPMIGRIRTAIVGLS